MLYPLKFNPILKDKIWGGTKLKSILNKTSNSNLLGESWELSGYENDESIVSNGFLSGNNLTELIEIYMGELVGDKTFDEYGLDFPLLFKFIDANENLSIQVHPGDEVAAERHNARGKTEMWYVIDAEPGGELIIGFSKDCTQQKYLAALKEDRVEDLLQKVKVKKGDVFFIPAGLVHAIGKGVVVAEIQQSSDLTYRIYDYKRTDDKGNERELHTEQALEVIDFSASTQSKINYIDVLNETTPLINCEYFNTNLLHFNKPQFKNYSAMDTFVTYMCIEGKFNLEWTDEKMTINKGETVLIPASMDELKLIPIGEVVLLEVSL